MRIEWKVDLDSFRLDPPPPVAFKNQDFAALPFHAIDVELVSGRLPQDHFRIGWKAKGLTAFANALTARTPRQRQHQQWDQSREHEGSMSRGANDRNGSKTVII